MQPAWSRKLPFGVMGVGFGAGFGLPLRIPLRLRFFFRAVFGLLALATVALALSVLVEEKQLSLRNYQDGFRKNLAQIAAELRHPNGQLALLNPEQRAAPDGMLRPLLLPFAAIDFDDRSKVQQAVEMSGCQVRFPNDASLCVAVGSNPWAGGFIYLAGSFVSAGELVPRVLRDADLAQAHRAQVEVQMRGQTYRWIAPFETAADIGSQSQSGAAMVRGRLTGFALDAAGLPANRPVRDFRGWLWQDGRCVVAAASASSAPAPAPAPATGLGADTCARRSFFSIRLPIDMWRDAIYAAKTSGDKTGPIWPPADLDRISVQLQMLPPRDGAAVFDSRAPGATPPFALADLERQLQAGETLRIRRLASADSAAVELAALATDAAPEPDAPRWLSRLIARLPSGDEDGNSSARETIDTSLARYEIEMTGDGRSVNRTLEAVATRVSWFVAAMLLAILLAWLAIEMRIIRRITLLSRRAAAVALTVRGTDEALPLDLSDLQSSDELGVLADALAGLLQRVNEDARRERIRTAQEKDQWHAVGHEIMSPLQSLKALHGASDDPSARYIHRMQQALRVLYGSASPSEAFAATTLASAVLDVDQFLQQIAANAPAAGIADVRYTAHGGPVLVRADEHALEDALAHVLRNADRYRTAASAIVLNLDVGDGVVALDVFNDGPPIAAGMLEKIFEYGVSDQADSAAQGSRGQGLFVARTYLAKMGGTIAARNVEGGVSFVLTLQRA